MSYADTVRQPLHGISFDLDPQTPTDYAAILAAELCLFDGLMTLPFWHLEGNPFVLTLGASGMLLVKLGAVSGLLGLWFRWPGVQSSRIARACVWAVCALYAVVVLTNALMLFAVV